MLVPIQAAILLVVVICGVMVNADTCTTNYYPCTCRISNGNDYVECNNIPISTVQSVFASIKAPKNPVILYLSPSTSAQARIPANVFGKVKVVSFTMYCAPSSSNAAFPQSVQPIIDPNAFSLPAMTYISFLYCDFVNQKDFNFLSGFNSSSSAGAELVMYGDINLEGFSVIPALPGLTTLQFDSCDLSGLVKAGFPDLSPAKLSTFVLFGFRSYSPIGNPLTDDEVSAILAKLGSSASSLNEIYLTNNKLTQIPENLKTFISISSLGLAGNKIQTLAAGQLDLPSTLKFLDLSMNAISIIEPGFFNQLKFGSPIFVGLQTVNLNSNQLAHFPSNVFQPLLQNLASINATVSLSDNMFICDPCEMQWLIQNNRQLLTSILGESPSSERMMVWFSTPPMCTNQLSFGQLDHSSQAFSACSN